jgi:hypothetical protein
LNVTQKTAWFMDHRIRLAMQSGTFEKVAGEFEVDESFIGGLACQISLEIPPSVSFETPPWLV